MGRLEQLLVGLSNDNGYALNMERRIQAYEIIDDIYYALNMQPGDY